MEKANKRRGLLIAAAVLLALGAAAAAVTVRYLQKKKQAEEDGQYLRLTDQTAPRYQCMRGNNYRGFFARNISAAEDGWFWLCQRTTSADMSADALTYTDKESGQSAFLCARPNCLHDGNLFCTASTKAYYDKSAALMADGYIYQTAVKIADANVLNALDDREKYYQALENMEPDKRRIVLLRYAADGSEVTEAADFGSGTSASAPLLHRGYIWFTVQLQNVGESSENPITHEMRPSYYGGWQLWGYELATGDSVKLCESMAGPESKHVNDPPYLFAQGDYLYLYHHPDNSDWDSPAGTERVSLLTGERGVAVESNTYIQCMTDGWFYGWRKKPYKEGGGISVFRMNPETGEEQPLSNDNWCWYVWDGYDIQERSLEKSDPGSSGWARSADEESVLTIRDLEGNVVKEIRMPLPRILDFSDETESFIEQECTICMQAEDTVLIEVTRRDSAHPEDALDDLMYLTFDEMLASDGEPEWHLAFHANRLTGREAD